MIKIACALQFHASVFPLLYHRSAIKRRGIDLHFMPSCDVNDLSGLRSFDYIFLSNRLYGTQFGLEEVRALSALGNKLYWFDETASTGTTNFEVLPFVDAYLKRQLLRDTALYSQSWYRRRIYTDYYHRRFGVSDTDPHYTEAALSNEHAHKLGVYWNLAYKDYRSSFRRLRTLARHKTALPILPAPRLREPSSGRREIDVFARMSIKTMAPSVGYQRREILRMLAGIDGNGVKVAHRGTVPNNQYERELAVSKTVVSPFGWGEICYRDFEAMVNGACLIKPDVSHLTTWPDVFVANKTYLPCSWDLADFPRVVEQALEGNAAREMATAAQDLLRGYIGAPGAAPFVSRLQTLLNKAL